MALNVLFVIDSLSVAGAERSLAAMLPHLRRGDVESSVVYLKACHRDDGLRRLVERRGFDTVRLRGGFAVQAKALRRMIHEERPDLVHTTLFLADQVGRLAAAGTGIPVLTSLVNDSYAPVRFEDPNVTPWKMRLVQTFDAVTARFLTAHFHAITEAVKAGAVRDLWIPPDRITVVERGRDPERMGRRTSGRRRRARQALGIAEEAEVVINVARQEYQKGQRYLLEAASLLSKRRPNLLVLIAGREGAAAPELKRMAEQKGRNGAEPRVRLLGHRDDVCDLLAAADLFAFPSLYEGLGGAVIEAMALGLPVVASDIPALREVVEEGRSALLVEPRAPEALAAAIGHLLERPEKAQAFGRRGCEIFAERFTLERNAERMVRLYHRLSENAALARGGREK